MYPETSLDHVDVVIFIINYPGTFHYGSLALGTPTSLGRRHYSLNDSYRHCYSLTIINSINQLDLGKVNFSEILGNYGKKGVGHYEGDKSPSDVELVVELLFFVDD